MFRLYNTHIVGMNEVRKLREEIPVGTKVELVYMEDRFSPPVGSIGVVTGIDDIGTIHVIWNNNCSLGLVYGIDKYKIL